MTTSSTRSLETAGVHRCGYAYRDTDDRDLMVAQSDIGSAHYEVFARVGESTDGERLRVVRRGTARGRTETFGQG